MIKINPLPPLEYLNECFELDLESPTGLKWKERPRHHFLSDRSYNNTNVKFKNKHAGTKRKDGYLAIYFTYNGVRTSYKIHRIIYAMHHKTEIPNGVLIDHIDRDKANNKIENLRLVNYTQNLANKVVYRNNTSGQTGVEFIKPTGRWRVVIQINNRNFSFGHYDTFEDAVRVRKEAEKMRDLNFDSDIGFQFCINNCKNGRIKLN